MGVVVDRRVGWAIGALTAAVTLGWCESTTGEWLGSWSATGGSLSVATILVYPCVAAVAAWVSGTPRRARFRALQDTAARSPLEVVGREVLGVWVWAAAGFLGAALIVLGQTAAFADFGSPPLLDVLVIVAGLTTMVGFGASLGRRLPFFIGPPLAAVAVYLAYGLLSVPPRPLAPFAVLMIPDDLDHTYQQIAAGVQVGRGAWLLASAGLCLTLAVRTSRWVLAAFGLVCALTVPLVMVGDSAMASIDGAMRPLCVTHAVTEVCLPAARGHLSADVWDAYRDMESMVTPLAADGRVALVDRTLTDEFGPTVDASGLLNIPIDTPYGYTSDAHRVGRDAFVIGLVVELLQTDCPIPSQTQPNLQVLATPSDAFQKFVLSEAGVSTADLDRENAWDPSSEMLDYVHVSSFAAALRKATPKELATWEHRNADAIVSCRLTLDQAAELR